MIYTVTLNPSFDFISQTESLKTGQINYAGEEKMSAGGHAIVISKLLKTMNVPTIATGFLGGKTGDFIEEELNDLGITNDFIRTKNTTRINLSIFNGPIETRIVGKGEDVAMEEVDQLLYYLARIREGDFLILAGSLPPNCTTDLYARMIETAVVNGAQFLPILNENYMEPFLKFRPLLITPTLKDLSSIFQTPVLNKEDAARYGMQCIQRGAQNVIINLERNGSLLVTSKGEIYEINGPDRPIISATYTHMAHTAGFVGNYMRSNDPLEAFRWSQGCSNATYYFKGLPDLGTIEKETKHITSQRIG